MYRKQAKWTVKQYTPTNIHATK